MDFKNKTIEELRLIASEALEAYEAGDSIMSDEEYDELRQYLQDENEAVLGSQELSKSKAYTVKHEFIMGSLDKVHTIRNEETGEINFARPVYTDQNRNACVLKELNAHLAKANNPQYLETTPKFDGCSFDLTVKMSPDDKSLTLSCSSRGDGQWGLDILAHFTNSHFLDNFSMLDEAVEALLVDGYDRLVIRGEAIVKNSVYNAKYADKFKNSRVFVSGTLNREFDADDKKHSEHVEACNDIDYICYDYRRVKSATGEYQELSWMNNQDPSYSLIAPYLGHIGQLPSEMCIVTPLVNGQVTLEQIEKLYNEYSEYRTGNSEYPLDGIVCKPECVVRQENLKRTRPVDQIAIKFIVEKMQSTIVDIVWSIGQTGECYPKAVVRPVYYDGKQITKASLHGYSYMLTTGAGVGSKVSMVMNGDIIPGVEEVLTPGEMVLPDFPTYVTTKGTSNVPHLYREFTTEEKHRHSFTASAKALKIDGIKEKIAGKLWDVLYEIYGEVFEASLENLMQLMNQSAYSLLETVLGNSKSTVNTINNLETYRKNMKLSDIIRGLCIESCGDRASEVCARILSGLEYDTTSLPGVSYSWALDKESGWFNLVEEYREDFGVPYLTEEVSPNNTENMNENEQIPVILTGVTTEAGYATKKDWLAAHPQYREVGNTKSGWAECKILFTNDLSSNTGKMKKARDLGVDVRVYEP